MIGFPHTDASKAGEVGDGIFHTFYDKTVSAVELLSVSVHIISEDACFNCSGDLGST